MSAREVVERFHRLYYDTPEHTWQNTRWLGTPLQKFATDLWIYQELIDEVRPDLIIETGTDRGGSALFMASICDLLNHGRIVTIDVLNGPAVLGSLPLHPRIEYVQGSSVSEEVKNRILALITPDSKIMVVLDSDHSKDHVLKEIQFYSQLVSVGSYLIVEDTNINGNPVFPDYGPGPKEAVETFLLFDREFEVDVSREKFFLSANPGGYLKRRKLGDVDLEALRRERELAERNAQLAERNAQLAERNAQLAERNAQLAERDAQLAGMLASKSWRLTAIFRRVLAFVRAKRGQR
jgi:cephalosporin hydroxylase